MQQERERRRQEDTFIMIDGLACSRRESQAAVAQLFASFCCGWLFVRSLLLVVRESRLFFERHNQSTGLGSGRFRGGEHVSE
jgi:hypothetical protein